MSDTVIIPFGKFKGMAIIDVAMADAGYLKWLTAQDWVRDKHPQVIEAIDALNGGADTTPVHNQIQAAFMDEDFALAALSPLFDSLTEQAEEQAWERSKSLNAPVTEPSVVRVGKHGTVYTKTIDAWPLESPWDLSKKSYENWTSQRKSRESVEHDGTTRWVEYHEQTCVVERLLKTRATDPVYTESFKVVAFEKFCDVSAEWQFDFRVDAEFDTERHIGTRCTGEIDPKYNYTEDRPYEDPPLDPQQLHESWEYEGNRTLSDYYIWNSYARWLESDAIRIGIEIKPTVGDEYPSIMRQMDGQRSLARKAGNAGWRHRILYTRDNVSSLSDEKLAKMFETNDIFLIIDRETDFPS